MTLLVDEILVVKVLELTQLIWVLFFAFAYSCCNDDCVVISDLQIVSDSCVKTPEFPQARINLLLRKHLILSKHTCELASMWRSLRSGTLANSQIARGKKKPADAAGFESIMSSSDCPSAAP